MIVLILVVRVLGIFLACLAAGRYASWFGVVVPVAITVALGKGWEWSSEATLVIIASALFGAGVCRWLVAPKETTRRVSLTVPREVAQGAFPITCTTE